MYESESQTESDSNNDQSERNDLVTMEPATGGVQPLLFVCKDRWNGVFLIFVFLGISASVPWNFFINAEGYWQYKFRDVNETNFDPSKRTSLQTSFTAYLSTAAMVAGTIGFLLCTFASARCSIHSRIVVPIVAVVVLLGVTLALVMINTDHWQSTFCIVTLACAAVMNGLTAFFQASAFGIAGLLHRKLIQAVMLGQAMSGILASIAKILTIIVDMPETTSATYYFSVALLMMIFCIVLYVLLLRTVYYKFHSARVSRFRLSRINDSSSSKDQNVLWTVTKNVKIYALSVIFVFVGTLAAFPAVAALVVSVDRRSTSPWTGKFFSPFACFLLYNVGDFSGRCIASAFPINRPTEGGRPSKCRRQLMSGLVATKHVLPTCIFDSMIVFWIASFVSFLVLFYVFQKPTTKSLLLFGISVVRLVYIPLVMLCNAQPRHFLPVLFDSDLDFIIIMATFALSNGYLASVCMMSVPKIVQPEHQESAGILMSLFMAIGILLGAILANPLLKIL